MLCCLVVQAVSEPQTQAGPSIEDAAQLLSSVAQPLFLTLHSQHADSLHDSQDQEADSQQPSDVLQAVSGNGNGVSNNWHSHDSLISRSSGGYSSSSSSSQNPDGELTYPYSPEDLTSNMQDLQIQVWAVFLACKSRSILWFSASMAWLCRARYPS